MTKENNALKVCMVGCWFKNDMYSHHLNNVMVALSNRTAVELRLVTSNCVCFSTNRQFSIAEEELLTSQCRPIKIPYGPPEPNRRIMYKIVSKLKLNWALEVLRGVRFYQGARSCNILHFDQVLKAFGVTSFLTLLFLSRTFGKKVIVTVHELDPFQVKYRALNKYYSWASRIIVFSSEFRNKLMGLGIDGGKIKVIPFCAPIEPIMGLPRDQFIYFGGHHLEKGKGFDTLLGALEAIRSRGREISVLIYTGNHCSGVDEAKQKVSKMGLTRFVRWSEFLSGADLARAYQKSIACVIPYTSGSGRHPVTISMANATPVIATKKADLPEYLGKLGIYIKENSAQELADAMEYLISSPDKVKSLGTELRKLAEEKLSRKAIGKQLLEIYRETYTSK